MRKIIGKKYAYLSITHGLFNFVNHIYARVPVTNRIINIVFILCVQEDAIARIKTNAFNNMFEMRCLLRKVIKEKWSEDELGEKMITVLDLCESPGYESND